MAGGCWGLCQGGCGGEEVFVEGLWGKVEAGMGCCVTGMEIVKGM